MNEFTFNKAFRRELRESAHHYGEVAFLESVLQTGMVVIEGGANRGVTAVAIAKSVGANGHVHAFEPVSEYLEVEDLDSPSDFERCSHIYATH